MRLNNKLKQFGGDEQAFWERLFMSKKAAEASEPLDLDYLMQSLAERFCIYFTAMEQVAIRDTLYPEFKGHALSQEQSRMLKVHLRSPENIKKPNE